MKQFLPNGYESLKIEKSYWKVSQMKANGSRLRIVMKPIAGWLEWIDKKPMRYFPDNKPATRAPKIGKYADQITPSDPPKPFWACYVWDYERESLFILEFTQMSIIKALTKIANDEDWGDFLEYDIKIAKEGSGKETRYVVTPLPHKPLSEKIVDALKRSPVRLEALYEGKDPWTDLTPSEVNTSTGEVINHSSILSKEDSTQTIGALVKLLEDEGISTDYLESYLEDLSDKKKQTVDHIIESALLPQLFPKFKVAYAKDIARREAEHSDLAAV